TRVLRPDGSLFLNVGAKPSDPWTALDVAQAVRRHLKLQNIIHWIKSIAIERELAGKNAGLERDLAVGHYKPINSDRFLNDCHEFVFHFTPTGTTELDRLALGVPYQDPSNIARWSAATDGVRCRGGQAAGESAPRRVQSRKSYRFVAGTAGTFDGRGAAGAAFGRVGLITYSFRKFTVSPGRFSRISTERRRFSMSGLLE